MTVLSADRVIALDGVLEPGWVEVAGGRITAVGQGLPERADLHGAVIVPGFVDLHCHGGGGASFDSADPGECARAAAFHRERGTTTLVASLVTAAPDDLERRASVLSELAADGVVAGIHYEGPFLSPARKGAHDPALLRAPEPDVLDRLLAGPVKMVTVAPELPGGLELVRRTVAAGAIAAIGHTDATYAQARAAFDAGARVATHLFNAMREIHHREPGPATAALEDERIVIELINDGVHLHDAIARFAFRPGRTAFVTDAMAAAGMPDGDFTLGALDVEVRDGTARLSGGGAIAGSTLTMDVAFRRAVQELGLPIIEAVHAAATTPARLLGLPTGALEEGLAADIVVLDDDLRVVQVVQGQTGTVATSASP
jgi:N-acetylglucosamine-6-phosphate deacetylase